MDTQVGFLAAAATTAAAGEKNWLLTLLDYSDLVVAVGVVAAVATYILRSRVDQADQWWKRVQYGLDLRRSKDPNDLIISNRILEMLQPEMPTGDEALGDHIARWYRNRSRWRVRRVEAQFVAGLLTRDVSDELAAYLRPTVDLRDNGSEGQGGST